MGQGLSPTGHPVADVRITRLDTGESSRRRRDPFIRVIAPQDGLLTVVTPSASWMVSGPLFALVVPAGVEYVQRGHVRTVVIEVPLAQHRIGSPDPCSPTLVNVTPLARCILLSLAETARPASHRTALSDVLAHELLRHAEPGRYAMLPTPRDARLVAVADTMIRHPDRQHRLESHARSLGISERTLRRLISTELALSFPQWRSLIRIIVSVRRLADGDTVESTAYACGFASTSAFIAAFRGVMGATPGVYRTRVRASRGADPESLAATAE